MPWYEEARSITYADIKAVQDSLLQFYPAQHAQVALIGHEFGIYGAKETMRSLPSEQLRHQIIFFAMLENVFFFASPVFEKQPDGQLLVVSYVPGVAGTLKADWYWHPFNFRALASTGVDLGRALRNTVTLQGLQSGLCRGLLAGNEYRGKAGERVSIYSDWLNLEWLRDGEKKDWCDSEGAPAVFPPAVIPPPPGW